MSQCQFFTTNGVRTEFIDYEYPAGKPQIRIHHLVANIIHVFIYTHQIIGNLILWAAESAGN